MAAIPWLQVSTNLPEHPKVLDLADMLGISDVQALGHLIRLWSWCGKFALDGCVRGPSAGRRVERAAGWTDSAGRFSDALISVRLLDLDGENLIVHDWLEHAGAYLERREADRERKRKAAKEKKKKGGKVPQEFQRNSDGEPAEGARNPRLEEKRREEKREEETTTLSAADAAAAEVRQNIPVPPTQPTVAAEVAALAPPKPKRERKPPTPSRQQVLAEQLRARRREVMPTAMDDTGDIPAGRLNEQIGTILEKHGEEGLRRGWENWLRDPWALSLDPPCPLNAFIAPTVWPQRVAAFAPKVAAGKRDTSTDSAFQPREDW